jgi:hypothetical protein
MKWTHSLLAGALVFLAGCSSAKIEDYADNKPTLDIREYFNGHVDARGMFVSRSGMADPRMRADMIGTWHGNEGTLEENFIYSDGHKQQRMWNIRFTDDHHFTATANDVIGIAQGTQYGNAMNMKYTLTLTTNDATHNVSMDDWVYLLDETTALNRAQMSKFGFGLGEVIFSFHKKP